MTKDTNKSKDASTSTNREAITQEMRNGYRIVLREKEQIKEDIRAIHNEIKQAAGNLERLKIELNRISSHDVDADSDGQYSPPTPLSPERFSSPPSTPPEEAKPYPEPPKKVQIPSDPPITIPSPPVTQTSPKFVEPAPKVVVHPPKATVKQQPTPDPRSKQPKVVYQKRLVHVTQDSSNDNSSAVIAQRELHMQIAALHDAIQRRVCFAGAFISLLLFIIFFY